MHGDYSDHYERLLDPFGQACEASETFEPAPGDSFAYLDTSEGAWYRARRLSQKHAALLDAAKIVALTPGDKCRRLPKDFAAIPEFCAHLKTDKAQLKDQVQCTVVSKSGDILNVSLVNLETGATLGTGTVQRWLPRVDTPAPAPVAVTPVTPAAAPAATPAAAAPAAQASGECTQLGDQHTIDYNGQ
ncbi:uncharacterized protein LOC125239496 [Leguminivora glycinivorella]|uniref:uncharacterized protein LOC125239496 n=1 Tax=Leguminivora glycinivorella TaxID=1035111 RepID=UPI00200E7112|nr:uncharacterized protein LOC125239496 [Leguminivora glycinivorella]